MRRGLSSVVCLAIVCAACSAVVVPRSLFADARLGAEGQPADICPTRVGGQIEQLSCPVPVIGRPKTIRITKYPPGDKYGKPAHPPLGVLARITRPSMVTSLVQEINQARWYPYSFVAGAYMQRAFCTGALGYLYLLTLTYANGDRWTVSVATDACQVVYAHGVQAAATPDLVRYLDSLGGIPPQAADHARW